MPTFIPAQREDGIRHSDFGLSVLVAFAHDAESSPVTLANGDVFYLAASVGPDCPTTICGTGIADVVGIDWQLLNPEFIGPNNVNLDPHSTIRVGKAWLLIREWDNRAMATTPHETCPLKFDRVQFSEELPEFYMQLGWISFLHHFEHKVSIGRGIEFFEARDRTICGPSRTIQATAFV